MNPELQRNLWLEVSLHRLVLIPGVIFAVAALLQAVDRSGMAVNKMSIIGFLCVTMVWGARQAANSVLEEARSRTWDIQRLCALSPWRMTWGKLIGATVMSWYAGLCCLLLFVGSGTSTNAHDALLMTLLVIAVAVLAHALALIGALVGLHRGSGLQSRFANLLVLVLLVFMLPNVMSLIDPHGTVLWYGYSLQRLAFGLFVTVFIAGFAGIAPTPSLALARCLCATLCVTAIVQSYIAAFAYPCDPVQLRRAERAFATDSYRRALEELPLWPVSAALALAAALAATALGSAPELSNHRLDNLGPVSLAAALMMLRDVALVSYFGMTLRKGVPEATTLIYIGVLDGLLPALLPRVGLASLTPLFWPPFFTAPLTAIAVLSVHVAVVWLLAWRAYRRLQAGINGTVDG